MLKVVQESNRDEPKDSGVSLLDEIAQTDHEEEAASNTSPADLDYLSGSRPHWGIDPCC